MLCPSSSTPAAAIGDADAVLSVLDDRLWAAVSDGDLLDGIAVLVEHEARVAALRAQLLAEIAARELPRKSLSWASSGDPSVRTSCGGPRATVGR
jgi:hypothetical protein